VSNYSEIYLIRKDPLSDVGRASALIEILSKNNFSLTEGHSFVLLGDIINAGKMISFKNTPIVTTETLNIEVCKKDDVHFTRWFSSAFIVHQYNFIQFTVTQNEFLSKYLDVKDKVQFMIDVKDITKDVLLNKYGVETEMDKSGDFVTKKNKEIVDVGVSFTPKIAVYSNAVYLNPIKENFIKYFKVLEMFKEMPSLIGTSESTGLTRESNVRYNEIEFIDCVKEELIKKGCKIIKDIKEKDLPQSVLKEVDALYINKYRSPQYVYGDEYNPTSEYYL
jgi:hypothetical protein